MIDGYIVDSNGFYIEPIINLPDDTKDGVIIDGNTIIVTRCPDGFYKPQWNGTAWVDAEAPTPAEQLATAQQAQIASIYAGLQATLNGTFQSKSTGHTYETSTGGQQNFIETLKLFELNPSMTSVLFFTTDAGWVSHTLAQVQSAFVDGGAWKQAQYAQYQTLEAQVKAATTVDTVNAIRWTTEATY